MGRAHSWWMRGKGPAASGRRFRAFVQAPSAEGEALPFVQHRSDPAPGYRPKLLICSRLRHIYTITLPLNVRFPASLVRVRPAAGLIRTLTVPCGKWLITFRNLFVNPYPADHRGRITASRLAPGDKPGQDAFCTHAFPVGFGTAWSCGRACAGRQGVRPGGHRFWP